ncbi:MAG: OsmC family protein [Pseudomonadota bacterium]
MAPALQFTARVQWRRGTDDFAAGRYSRAHEWRFDGGLTVPASASPHIVPAPWSAPEHVDPEEAFVAAISSCHMLFFLHFARDAGFVLDSYCDGAVGEMATNENGQQFVSRVALRPVISCEGAAPDAGEAAKLHDRAHHACFIANSVKTVITVETVC